MKEEVALVVTWLLRYGWFDAAQYGQLSENGD
jgi:hypothetical protein